MWPWAVITAQSVSLTIVFQPVRTSKTLQARVFSASSVGEPISLSVGLGVIREPFCIMVIWTKCAPDCRGPFFYHSIAR